MNILVTAIGSFSADCVITTLKAHNNKVIGVDIYPEEWHAESLKCDRFYQSPLAIKEKEYVDFLIDICKRESISHLIPLTDVEIDVLDKNRKTFCDTGIILCMPDSMTLSIARDKYSLYKTFRYDRIVNTVPTYKIGIDDVPLDIFPCIAKPVNGRSSEGLMRIFDYPTLQTLIKTKNYIVQNLLEGPIFTVDYVRSRKTNHDFSVPREELLRTKNGAGITVKVTTQSDDLIKMVSYIGQKLDINGCVNMEFIYNEGKYYLIDINPRFSAGIAFTHKIGYDIVTSHMNCHMGKDILPPINIEEHIICKNYIEIVTK